MSEYQYGQWLGLLETKGIKVSVILNLERRSPGMAQLLEYAPQNPEVLGVTDFKFQENGNGLSIQSPDMHFVDSKTGALIPRQEVWKLRKIKQPIPKRTSVMFHKRGKILEGEYKNDVGAAGTFVLSNTTRDPAQKPEHTLDWKHYTQFVGQNYLNKNSIIFRGQPNNQWKLRTSFHRCERNNLLLYLNEDIPNLRHAVNALSNYYYREDDREALGALLSLAQHHGYPTPLLDWTYSPYIAAFFAFTELGDNINSSEAVRIFVFDTVQWPLRPALRLIHDPTPSVTFHRPSAHNNPRFIPQQSIASFSNVDDMEAVIRGCEKATSKKYLTIIDIPLSEKRKALDELRLMGITASALFPGLDGVCRALKERDFQY